MKYPDCRIKENDCFGEFAKCDTVWNIHGWQGEYILLRNKKEIFKIFVSFPDEFMKDYFIEDGKILLGKFETKKWYKK